jgi:hypothetical protein
MQRLRSLPPRKVEVASDRHGRKSQMVLQPAMGAGLGGQIVDRR